MTLYDTSRVNEQLFIVHCTYANDAYLSSKMPTSSAALKIVQFLGSQKFQLRALASMKSRNTFSFAWFFIASG